MKSDEVLAVVVSFNGGDKTIRTINALLGQVGHVHVVDNSSNYESVSSLEEISSNSDVSVTWLPENKGIGYALNDGLRIARENGYSWLLTMDQDSTADPAMIQAFSDVINENPSFVCLASQTLEHILKPSEKFLPVDYSITSGNLVRLDVFDQIGQYDEDLFIDCVDFDFSLRVRRAGLSIYLVGAARMQHELGDKVCDFPVVGRFHTFHSPLRRYYIYRNYFYLVCRYSAEFPLFALKLTVSRIVNVFTIFLFGERRFSSIHYVFLGILDFFRGKKGPYLND